MTSKREVSLFDSDYWQSLQNGKSPVPLQISAPSPTTKHSPENVAIKDPFDIEKPKIISG
jgi:hypothetical protein